MLGCTDRPRDQGQPLVRGSVDPSLRLSGLCPPLFFTTGSQPLSTEVHSPNSSSYRCNISFTLGLHSSLPPTTTCSFFFSPSARSRPSFTLPFHWSRTRSFTHLIIFTSVDLTVTAYTHSSTCVAARTFLHFFPDLSRRLIRCIRYSFLHPGRLQSFFVFIFRGLPSQTVS